MRPASRAWLPRCPPPAGQLAVDTVRGAAARCLASRRRGARLAPSLVPWFSGPGRVADSPWSARARRTCEAAHRHGGTVNNAVLTVIAGALHRVLGTRGESIDTIAIAVPVGGRRSATASELGNQVGPMLVPVPGAGISGTTDPAGGSRRPGPQGFSRGPAADRGAGNAVPGRRRRSGRIDHSGRARRGRRHHRVLRSCVLRRHRHDRRDRRPPITSRSCLLSPMPCKPNLPCSRPGSANSTDPVDVSSRHRRARIPGRARAQLCVNLASRGVPARNALLAA